MNSLRTILVLILIPALSGCATLFAGGNDDVRFESDPPGATVTTQNGLTLGTTPFTTSLNPEDYIIQFTLNGHRPQTYSLGKKVDGIAFLNLLCLLCWGIDFATGDIWGLENDFVRVTLTPEGQSSNTSAEVHALACRNYAALKAAYLAGQIDSSSTSAGAGIVTAATGVEPEVCTSVDQASTLTSSH